MDFNGKTLDERGLTQSAFEWVADWGAVVMEAFATLGELTLFCMQTFRWMIARPPRWKQLTPTLYQVGVLSLPVVALTGTFIGMVLAVQCHSQMKLLGLETRMGAVINFGLVRELGPVLAATMLAGRVGSSMAAELGSMRVTEQIDALDGMGVNPVHHLVVPRFLACLLMIPILTIMADFMGIVGGYFFTVLVLSVDRHHYWANSRDFVGEWDLFTGIFKSFSFGAAIALISCHRGFNCGAGAQGVARATIASFVYSFVMILVLDLLLNLGLDAAFNALWPAATAAF